jgi:hypothetical protein
VKGWVLVAPKGVENDRQLSGWIQRAMEVRQEVAGKVKNQTMTTAHTHILDLVKEAEPPADGILSRTIFSG